MKKLTALLLALVMVLAMNATALAGTIPANGISGDNSAKIETIDFTVNYNVEPGVDAPDTTFTYTLTKYNPGLADGAVLIEAVAANGSDPAVPEIRNGLATNGATLPTPTVTVDETAPGAVTINTGTGYTTPGIYRYKLTQADLTQAQEDAGVIKADTYNDLILDIYVTNVNGNPVPSAVVLHKDNVAQDENADKVAGFNNTYSPSNPTPGTGTPDPSNPVSYDLTITKEVDGNAASHDQEFAFTITLTPPANDASISFADLEVGVESSGVTTPPASTLTLNNGTNATLNVNMKHNSSIVIKGLPQNTTVSVSEVPLDYTPSNTVTNMTAVSAQTGKDTGTYKTTSAANNIAFTNERADISPTGVVLRVAPYAIMLGAGVVLFIILKSRKNKAVEEA